MIFFLILAITILISLSGCANSTSENSKESDQLIEKCPIQKVKFRSGPGKLPKGMTVSWDKDVYDTMEKYPYVRHDTWDSENVHYCEICEKEIDTIHQPVS